MTPSGPFDPIGPVYLNDIGPIYLNGIGYKPRRIILSFFAKNTGEPFGFFSVYSVIE